MAQSHWTENRMATPLQLGKICGCLVKQPVALGLFLHFASDCKYPYFSHYTSLSSIGRSTQKNA